MPHRGPIRAWVVLGIVAALGPFPQDLAGSPGDLVGTEGDTLVTVHGTITDRSTDDPLEGVAVHLRSAVPDPPAAGEPASAVTDAGGAFLIPGVRPGEYVLETIHLGYRDVEETVRVTGEGDLQIQVGMVPRVIELDPVVATSVRRIPPRMEGFYERKDRGFGRFLSRDDIERRNPFRVTDLFRQMAGVRVEPGRTGSGGEVLMRGGCRPDVFVDGIRASGGAFLIDDHVSTNDLEAVEVYSLAEVPGEFAYGNCGAIVMWTRRPGTDGGRPFSWRRLLAAAGLLGGFILLR